jgi:hypothetical protein
MEQCEGHLGAGIQNWAIVQQRRIRDNSGQSPTIAKRGRSCNTYGIAAQRQLDIAAILHTGNHVLNHTPTQSNGKCLRRELGRSVGRALEQHTALGDVEHHCDAARPSLQLLSSLAPPLQSLWIPARRPSSPLSLCAPARRCVYLQRTSVG